MTQYPPRSPSRPDDLAPYAGRWVALVGGRVVATGRTAQEARRAAKRSRPKEDPQVRFVPAAPLSTVLADRPWQAVRRLAAERGARIWPVGGIVRDILLGRPVRDWDIVVEGDALSLARAVADALDGAYFALDEERGAGRVILKTEEGDQMNLDLAALRGGSLEADLTGRDFTINALALDETGAVIDLVGGQADLEAGLIRATSEHAFRDDPARLLRAARLESELGFEIEPQTATWLRRDAALASSTSAERVRDELMRLFKLPAASSALERLDAFGLLEIVLPELEALKGVAQSPPHRHDVWRHSLATVEVLEGILAIVAGQKPPHTEVPSAAWGDLARTLGQFTGEIAAHLAIEISCGRDRASLLKLAALLHDIGKPSTRSEGEDERIHFFHHELVGAQMAAAILERLRFSRDEIERVGVLVGQHMRPALLAQSEEITRRAVYRYFRATGCAGVDVALLALADHLAARGPELDEARWTRRLSITETLLLHYFAHREETIAPPPLITGDDLKATLGLAPGPQIGRLLEAVREAQAAGEVRTREEALALAKRIASLDNPYQWSKINSNDTPR